MDNTRNRSYTFFILTGEPGVGKTTLIKKLSTNIAAKGIKTTGFYTEEVRRNGTREGFDVVSLEGARGPLARNQSLINGPIKYKVGKYGVLLQEFEKIALPTLVIDKLANALAEAHLLVIDEIGKMECFSDPFKIAIRTIFSPTSRCTVLATIPVQRAERDHLVESIRNHSLTKVWTVTRENRNYIHDEILQDIYKAYTM